MLKLKMMLLRDDVAAGRRRFCRQSISLIREAAPPPAWIMQPPPTGRHRAEQDYLRLRADHYAKTTGRNPSILMSSADKVAISMGNSCNYCEQYTRASSGV